MAIRASVPPVACMRVADVAPGIAIPAEVEVGFCAGCQARVYTAPSTRAMARAGQAQVTCYPCARLAVGAEALCVLTSEARREMQQWKEERDGR